MSRLLAMLALLGSTTTLVCCVIPAVLVALGFGATFAALISAFPQITWLSEYKAWVFLSAGILLVAAGVFQWRQRAEACPADPVLAEACRATRGSSFYVLIAASVLYLLGFVFAYVLPLFIF